jgi:predicted nucleic acid-binding protein
MPSGPNATNATNATNARRRSPIVSVVVDASAALDIGLGLQARLALLLAGEDLHVPMTFDVEVAAALCRLELDGTISPTQAVEVRAKIATIGMSRTRRARWWTSAGRGAARSPSRAASTSLARLLGARLLTTDDRLARAAVDLVPLLR